MMLTFLTRGTIVATGNAKQLALFIKAGASVNAYDQEGWTPLMNAALHGHLECVNMLLSAGADPHLVDDQKQTCLHKATYHAGKAAVVEALLSKGTSIHHSS
jgi:ankyrin repeat protein